RGPETQHPPGPHGRGAGAGRRRAAVGREGGGDVTAAVSGPRHGNRWELFPPLFPPRWEHVSALNSGRKNAKLGFVRTWRLGGVPVSDFLSPREKYLRHVYLLNRKWEQMGEMAIIALKTRRKVVPTTGGNTVGTSGNTVGTTQSAAPSTKSASSRGEMEVPRDVPDHSHARRPAQQAGAHLGRAEGRGRLRLRPLRCPHQQPAAPGRGRGLAARAGLPQALGRPQGPGPEAEAEAAGRPAPRPADRPSVVTAGSTVARTA